MRPYRNADAPAGTRAQREGRVDQPNATATRRPVATDCGCQACADLLAECGEHFPLYSRKLLIRGWAGTMSIVERTYVRAHRSEAQQARAAAQSARMQGHRFGPRTRVTDGKSSRGGRRTRFTVNPAPLPYVVPPPARDGEVSS